MSRCAALNRRSALPRPKAVRFRRPASLAARSALARPAQVDDVGHGSYPGGDVSGRTTASNSSAVAPERRASSLKVVPFLCAALAMEAALSPIPARRHEHQGRSNSSPSRSRFGSMPTTALSVKLTAASARRRIDLQADRVGDHGLEDVELEMSLAAREHHRRLVSHHLCTDHCHGFGLGGVHLPGHDRGAGFVLEGAISPSPERAPPHQPQIVGDLEEPGREARERSWVNTRASWQASASNLFTAVVKGKAVSSITWAAKRSAKSGCR